MDIEFWRNKIDAIDARLVELLNERSRCALEIGRLKRKANIALYQPEREQAVIRQVTELNSGPLDAEAIKRLFERIIDESRRLERISLEKSEANK